MQAATGDDDDDHARRKDEMLLRGTPFNRRMTKGGWAAEVIVDRVQ